MSASAKTGAVVTIGLLISLAGAGLGWLLWPRELRGPIPNGLPVVAIERNGALAVRPSGGTIVARVARSENELSAYLDFEYVRSLPLLQDRRVMLAAAETRGGPDYSVYVALPPDWLTAYPLLSELKGRRLIADFGVAVMAPDDVSDLEWQTQLFVWAYNQPVRTRFDQVHAARLLPAMARFILFKSRTDRRVQAELGNAPTALSLQQASTLAADIVAVAQFYSLPTEFLLGIGAMENNYMSAMGDLAHSVWKRRVERGDIVLARRRGRVLVRNFSIGVWQITRETLRYAHKLYLADTRDYSSLPERLRPPRNLDLDAVDQDVLTTYAGLLFRDLLDHFGGDIERAVAAYNGGVDNPNLNYAAGVANVAEYARNVLEHAVALDGRTIPTTLFLSNISSSASE